MFGSSKQLAQMAAQQEALRRELQKMSDALNKDGKQGNGALQKIAQEMEKTENDIVNRNITQETLKRQSEILTKLLEAEKADQERDEEEKRKSNEAKNQMPSNPSNFLEYRLLKMREAELLKTVSPALTPYYKNKVTEYFNSIK
jgi:deoxyribodipyrimidine photolyase